MWKKLMEEGTGCSSNNIVSHKKKKKGKKKVGNRITLFHSSNAGT